ncbi:hypothetical protein ACFVU2_09875 [Leifsonia sp. NPDC058194]|uniref:hypothetical protein n=1 Tax=Leifsonia sp. NPDC058194 TaxID=3346374 RepID=UPI0036D887AD
MPSDEIERRELLAGHSANWWSGVSLGGGALWLVGSIGGVICGLTIVRINQRLDPVTIGFLALFALGLAVLVFGDRMAAFKAKKEVAAGYTTMAQGHYEVERRHSPTGVVMRQAGQPNLTRSEWESAMVRVRAFEGSRGKEHGS